MERDGDDADADPEAGRVAADSGDGGGAGDDRSVIDRLDDVDRGIVNGFQGGFPVVERPFEPAAAALRERGRRTASDGPSERGRSDDGLDVDAAGLVERLRRLEEIGATSRFGPLIDADAIGGRATLAALAAPDDRFDAVAEAVNDRQEVAHNYERDHPYLNMWFVVSVADPGRVDEVLAAIEDDTGLETYAFPKLTAYHVGARFPVPGPLEDEGLDLTDLAPEVEPRGDAPLDAVERDLLVAVHDGLPLVERPYAAVADEVGVPVDRAVRTLERLRRGGQIRRVGVVPDHYGLGYGHNGMTVWDVPDGAVDAAGRDVAALPCVTHCYERPRHGDVWPYNLFAMVHGRSADAVDERIAAVRGAVERHCDLDDGDWTTVFSTRLLKKTGIRLEDRLAGDGE